MATDPDGTGAREQRLGEILGAYFVALEAGRAATREELLAQHPDLAAELAEYFAEQDRLDAVIAPLRPPSAATPGGKPLRDRAGSLSGIDRKSADSTTIGPTPAQLANGGSAGPPSTSGVLDSLTGLLNRVPRVLLRDTEPEPGRGLLVQPSSPEMPVPADRPARLQLFGEIARGGMGVVLKGRDVDLGRDLAVKVLLERYRDDDELLSRFIEEAQIGGQLQHPGIVPIYELGKFADRRPYFAMKLVQGRTLAALLAERPDPAADLPRFLGIFESVCQTIAYAHARGVIHRDLKPSNVMVGSFGEVQVMDWGLAKVLPQGGNADEARSRDGAPMVVWTIRSGLDADESRAGSVLGTPAYMAPEQARGEIDRLDERCDVFGLGAILCEILTGGPPFVGATRGEIQDKAARGDLADAFGRLEASGADPELVSLAKDCLAAEPAGRPRDAGAVASRITAYLAAVQERLKVAELARVEAQAKAAEERKRRRLTVALAASVLVIGGLAGGGWAYVTRQQQAQLARIDRAMNRAQVLFTDAQQAGDDRARWITARDAAQAVEGLLIDAPDEPTRKHMTALVHDVAEAAAAAENDQKLLAKLVDIRSAKDDDPDGLMSEMDYANAFAEAGIDTAALSPAEVGAKIQARPVTVRVALAAALDDWAAVRRGRRGDEAGARRLTEAASRADPDPWRNRLRNVLQAPSRRERLADLKELAKSAQVDELPAVSLNLLGTNLFDAGDPTGAEAVLHQAQGNHPGDLWINYSLAQCLERLARREEAIRYYMAARSIRPETAHNLAHALDEKGETDQAIALFQGLARLRPKESRHLTCLGEVLQGLGRTEEAKAALDVAITASRAAVALQPGRPYAHLYLGLALSYQGKHDEAIAEFGEALRLKPDFAAARFNLGAALINQGKLQEGITEYREALRLRPDYAAVHVFLGIALHGQGKLEEAITEYREAIRLRPDFAAAHGNLGNSLHDQGKLEEAIAEYREAIRLRPNFYGAHSNLGNALREQGKLEEAIAECREAIRLKPDTSNTHVILGLSFRSQGELTQAIAEFRNALDLARKNPDLARQIERDLTATEHQAPLAPRLPAVLAGKLKPNDAVETLGFAQLCSWGILHGASAQLMAKAFDGQPKLAEDLKSQNRYNAACAAALAGCGQGKDQPPLDEATKVHWRKQALDWLKADLAAWSKLLASGPPQARQLISDTLQHWKADPDLAGLRDPAMLAKLPMPEQAPWRELWSAVDRLLEQAQGHPSK